MNKNSIIVNAALDNIIRQDSAYASRMFAQRLPGGAGSIFEGYDRDSLEAAVRSANWVKASHPDIGRGCQGYVTNDIPGGMYGMVRVAAQSDDTLFEIADFKNTGKVSLVVKGATGRIKTDETWLIIGPNEGEDVVYTFYPGEPTPMPTTSTDELPVGTVLTKAEALAKGFNLAKVG